MASTDKLKCSAEYFTSTWRKYDADGNGYIEESELTNFLTDLLAKEEAQTDFKSFRDSFLGKYDKNKDGKIDMKELADVLNTEEKFKFLIRTERGPSSVEFTKIWKQYDTDNSGFIEAGELKNFLKDAYSASGNPLPAEKLDEYTKAALQLYDKDGNHKLDFNEMVNLLPLPTNYLKDLQFDKLTEAEFKSIFGHYDKNKDNTIEDSELDNLIGDLLKKEGKAAAPEAVAEFKKAIMHHCDKNKDGKIQMSELKLVLNFRS